MTERPADMGGWVVTITITNTTGERIGAKQFGSALEAKVDRSLDGLISDMQWTARKRFDEALIDALYRSGLTAEEAIAAVRTQREAA